MTRWPFVFATVAATLCAGCGSDSDDSAAKPAVGHFVTLDITAETSPGYEPSALSGGFHPGNNWGMVDAEGITQPRADSDAAYTCHAATWPTQIVPAGKFRFRVTLDSRTPTGVVTYVLSDNPGGREWAF